MMAALLEVEGLAVTLRTQHGARTIIHDIGFAIAPGQTMALVGESGSGKSLTALALLGLLPGAARVTGGIARFGTDDLFQLDEARLRALRGGRIGMVFQEPMTALNPIRTIGAQIVEAITLHRPIGRAAAWAEALSLLDAVRMREPPRVARSYPHQLSGGMRQRVLIAIAIACAPQLLIADEPTTALDTTTQAEVLALLHDLQARLGMAILLITHDLDVVAQVADTVAVVYAGQLVEQGKAASVLTAPAHPYTRGLLAASRLAAYPPASRLPEIRGTIADLPPMAQACRFAPRCDLAVAACLEIRPAPAAFNGRTVICRFPSSAEMEP